MAIFESNNWKIHYRDLNIEVIEHIQTMPDDDDGWAFLDYMITKVEEDGSKVEGYRTVPLDMLLDFTERINSESERMMARMNKMSAPKK